jgi:hypothetical protein
LGKNNFKPLDEIIVDGFEQVKEIQNGIKDDLTNVESALENGGNKYMVDYSTSSGTADKVRLYFTLNHQAMSTGLFLVVTEIKGKIISFALYIHDTTKKIYSSSYVDASSSAMQKPVYEVYYENGYIHAADASVDILKVVKVGAY